MEPKDFDYGDLLPEDAKLIIRALNLRVENLKTSLDPKTELCEEELQRCETLIINLQRLADNYG